MPSVKWNEVPQFYHRYIAQVKATSLEDAFAQHQDALPALLEPLAEVHWEYAYAPDKWSIKAVVQHIIDTERILSYRALAFSRGEKQPLPGFDENAYAAGTEASLRSKQSLLEEFAAVQKASRLLFASFTPGQLALAGTANNNTIYVEGIGFIIVGHCLHHLQILEERYLNRLQPTPGA